MNTPQRVDVEAALLAMSANIYDPGCATAGYLRTIGTGYAALLQQLAEAERAREECVADVERRFLSVRDMLPGDYITGYTEALAHIRAAFLAANGGSDGR